MRFSEWTKRADSHVIDNAAGDNYEQLPDISKECIDNAVERFFRHRCSLPLSEQYLESKGFKFIDMMFENKPMRYWRKDKIIVRKHTEGWFIDLFNDKEQYLRFDASTIYKFESFINQVR